MRAADLIIVFVGSPGAIAEAITISRDRALCGKASFYCFEDHKDGLVVKHLEFMAAYGTNCQLVSLAQVQPAISQPPCLRRCAQSRWVRLFSSSRLRKNSGQQS